MKRLTYLLLCLFASIAFATAQTTKVTGTVISAEDDGPIIGASIVVAGTTTGTVTDYNGAFTLDVPSNAKKLIVSYIGMKSVEVAVKPIIKVTMESDSQNLDEVVVVGYGQQKKVSITGAVGNIKSDTLNRLAEVLEQRKQAAPDSSYVASLYHKGLNKILEKLGEESVETIIAAKDAAISKDCSDVIYETADLWFHSLVMLSALGQHPQAVLDELERRFGLSGHDEKAARQPSA